MNQELSKNLVCICMRNKVEIWVEKERAELLVKNLGESTSNKFVEFENQLINTADIVGIFTAQTMGDLTRLKNGQWKCGNDNWHDKFQRCVKFFNCS